MRLHGTSRRRIRAGLLAIAKAGVVACVTAALLLPANAQFWTPWGGSSQQRSQQRQPQQGFNPFGGWFGSPPPAQQRDGPTDYSRAPGPQRKTDPAATIPIVVMGDAMSDWLAYGLEDALSEKPEFSIVRKNRTYSGLIRYETRRDVEWAQVAKEIIAAEKPKVIVMMIGVHDRQVIRERAPAAPARQSRTASKQGAAPAQPPPPPDPELQAQQSADQQNAALQESPPEQPAPAPPEQGRGNAGNAGPFEFRTEQWEAAYIKRIDATIAVLKSAGVPVLWVGLPSQRNARASADSVYLNELYRQRAEKAGITYVDVWDGFVDNGGQFTAQGPDFEGQIRRLRSGDGVYFTKAGARKLAHYVEREIQRGIANRALPMALPIPEPTPATPRPGGPAQRPLVGPVVPLTISTTGPNELLGGGPGRAPAADPVATRVLTKGEPVSAPNGRADDFSWPRSATVIPDPPPAPLVDSPPPPAPEQAKGQTGEQKQQPVQRRPRTPSAADRRAPAGMRPSAFVPPIFQGLFR